jgi:hypothetical protein
VLRCTTVAQRQQTGENFTVRQIGGPAIGGGDGVVERRMRID